MLREIMGIMVLRLFRGIFYQLGAYERCTHHGSSWIFQDNCIQARSYPVKLQILVPHWQESNDDIAPLLESLDIQQGIDLSEVGVIVAYDGPDASPLDLVGADLAYKFDIQKIVLPEKKGVSAARNAAMDAATADYVMFCDADDMFCNVCGLHILFNEMEIADFDTLMSVFIEESRHPETKKPLYVNHDVDSTFVHGKVHRLAYLRENGIRWNENLTVHEDSYFNILAQNLTPEVKYCPYPFYLWKWRDASVCRHDPDYILKTYNNMLDSNDALVDEFERRGIHDKARFYACFMIMDAYYTMNKREWLDKTHKDYRDAVEERFAAYFAKHKPKWEEMDDAERMQISNGVRTRSVMEGMPMEVVTIDDWLRSVEGRQPAWAMTME